MVQKFDFQELDLKGAYLIKPFYATDNRGGLIKDYNVDVFQSHGIQHELKEVFYTISKRGVIRATHFQIVKQQAKLVRCIRGHVYDVIVDLRPGSPNFGQWRGFSPHRVKTLICYWFRSFLDTVIWWLKILLSATSVLRFSTAREIPVSCTTIRTLESNGLSN